MVKILTSKISRLISPPKQLAQWKARHRHNIIAYHSQPYKRIHSILQSIFAAAIQYNRLCVIAVWYLIARDK